MKYFMTMTSLLMCGLTANAGAPDYSKISCVYGSSSGNTQTVTFEGPKGVNLAWPGAQDTVPLKVQGSNKPQEFNVDMYATRFGHVVQYTYTNPFFISDISLSIEFFQNSEVSTITGTWKVDHPPMLELECHFGN